MNLTQKQFRTLQGKYARARQQCEALTAVVADLGTALGEIERANPAADPAASPRDAAGRGATNGTRTREAAGAK